MLTSGILGIPTLILIAVLLSERKRSINLRIVASTFLLQASVAGFALLTPMGQTVLGVMSRGVQNIITYADVGILFMFGDLGDPSVAFIVAFRVLPVIVFVSSLVAVLYYLNIIQLFIRTIGYLLRVIVGTSRLESTNAAANIFIGMVESPMTIRPYLSRLTRSQLFAVMSVGLSSVTGAILVGYASLGVDLQYLLPAAFMSAPGGLLMAKLLVPETGTPFEPSEEELKNAYGEEEKPVNIIEAAADGASAGLMIAANVGAMILCFVAIVALINGILGGIGGWFGYPNISLELFLGYLLAPITFLIGIPWDEAVQAGSLLGKKVILNEFIAYVDFASMPDAFSAHSKAVITFALCGFANLSGLAILMGGLASMVPSRKSDVAQLGFKTVLAGTLANLMSAALASVFMTLAA